ncbi:hypothetical protein [uncultured Novosphingobium sp.]|uniref:hypothetical protein n=1 Tax=uncultured Novosphingobium sp. TaxID=292277 RepID=UPI00374A5A1C
MTLEQQLSTLLAKHDLLSVGIDAMTVGEDVLVQANAQCMVKGTRTAFAESKRGGDASVLLAQVISQANAARFVPAEAEQLSGLAA